MRAGRRPTLGCEPELVTWPPLATGPDTPRARISRCRVARRRRFEGAENVGYGHANHWTGYPPCVEAVAWKDGKHSRLGRVIMRREPLEAFATQLCKSNVVAIEATGNAASVASLIGPHVSWVFIANPNASGGVSLGGRVSVLGAFGPW